MPRAGLTRAAGAVWPALALMLVAFNLRPALSSIGPILGLIRDEVGLSGVLAGALITVPVLCLGVFGRLVPPLVHRIGPDAGVLAALVVTAVGLVLRGFDGLVPLFSGSVLAAAGIGIVGVILPGVVKRDFPDRAGLMTGLYTGTLCLGASAGAGLTVPAARALGHWQGALMLWALPALVAALAWLPMLTRPHAHAPVAASRRRMSLWRDPLAWQVTAFMGAQSSLAYVVFGWLPAALIDRGFAPVTAGALASVSAMSQVALALVVPTLAGRRRDQRLLIVPVVALPMIGFGGLLVGPPALAWMFAVILGLGLGGCFGLALTLIVLRAPDPSTAGDLSAMAQGIGYCVAALGPLLIGAVHEASGGWDWPAAVYAALALTAMGFGLGAARDRQVAG
ncbi:MFS transporter [uncultured Methylobacterium sp.]|uniref:CynX/NimT family MFS transporter n=1 Tax=uncultured Methylobacterium sp. TaxID=157278 RepID=UPI002605A7F5|nr:MFS transporter [uncultured Methylobacterium sp.]